MTKKMLIDATHAEETRVVVVDGTKVEEFDFETVNKRQLAGNIYLAKVTRVEPSLQAAFVDYGGNRHGFLAFSEIHPDYYQIPVADRQALLAEERAYARSMDEEEGRDRGRRPRPQPAARSQAPDADEVVHSPEITAMDVVDLGEQDGADSLYRRTEPAVADEAVSQSRNAAVGGEAESYQSDDHSHDHAHVHHDGAIESSERRYHAVDHASDVDDEIESIAEEDVADEISQQRRPRARRYKIQEVIKVRQIMLVQVVKEERGNKGAALTTYLSLAGRYCVLMPNTARGGGISRKITNAADRKKLKEIAGEIEVPEGAGLIIRTAGSQRTKTEIKRDYEYLQRLWEQIRDLTLKSIAPAPIYEEGTLIKRVIRDLYNRDIEEVLVEGPDGYRVAKDFMRMIMPSHAKNVQHYHDQQPLFAKFGVESYLASMFNPVVQLKSGGYIVIGITEALVAIDVNSGRATKEGSIEETALKTNLEAAEEVARQLRLRDLAGLIVIDFIDMEERRNNASVEKRLKDKLKTDRARIQVGRISGFGLMEMSRQRLRPGMLEASTAPCNHCHGTGLIRSDDSLALMILRQLEEEGTRKRSKEVLLKAPVAIVNFLMNQKREHIAGIEARYGMAVRIEADPSLISPDFSIEKFKVATRVVAEVHANVVSLDTSSMADYDEADDAEIETDAEVEADIGVVEDGGAERSNADRADGNGGKKKRRRRRRRKGGSGLGTDALGSDGSDSDADGEGGDAVGDDDDSTDAATAESTASTDQTAGPEQVAKSKSRSRSRSGSGRRKSGQASGMGDAGPVVAEATDDRGNQTPHEPAAAPESVSVNPMPEAGVPEAGVPEAIAPAKKPSRIRKPSAKKLAEMAGAEAAAQGSAEPDGLAIPASAGQAVKVPVMAEAAHPSPTVAGPTKVEPEQVDLQPAMATADAEADDGNSSKPKKRGWWSLAR